MGGHFDDFGSTHVPSAHFKLFSFGHPFGKGHTSLYCWFLSEPSRHNSVLLLIALLLLQSTPLVTQVPSGHLYGSL